jgi:transcriptional regulator with XRE-family HTH domain
MQRLDFAQLLGQHMRRIRASAAGVAVEIGLSREAVNNWRNGDARPGRQARDKVLAAARYLRLTETETNDLLQAAGFEPEFARAPHAAAGGSPTSQASPAVQQVFERLLALRPYPILMLLCPAHLGQPPQRPEILAEAQRRYGAERVLHMQPPYSLSAEPSEYFAAIATQCGLEGVDSDYAFESALAARLVDPRPLFCLVSRFEQGDPALRELLAGILRSLSEMHSGKLVLLICGGAALADLKYQGGDLSLLNIASAERWPEPQAADLFDAATARGVGAAEAQRAVLAGGGHPLLIEAALELLAEQPGIVDTRLHTALARFDPLWPGFLPLLQSSESRSRLAQLLAADSLGPARPYLLDPLLRHLYWANLIVERGRAPERQLCWRCPAVRAAGQAALAAVAS